MKIKVLLLLCCVLQTYASQNYAQETSFSINASNTTLENIIEKIEKQSEFRFLYNSDLIDTNREVSINVESNSVQQVLNQALAGSDVDYTIQGKQIVLSKKAPDPVISQASDNRKKITGVIVDEDNLPLIGVSVQLKATKVGTVTDIDGNFSINVQSGDELEFTYIGFKPQSVKVTTQSEYRITMIDASLELTTVVVTALGLKREEKALGYAVTELKGEDLYSNTINPINSLQGKVAGVDIVGTDGGLFGSTKIQIRGSSTLKGNNQPIYVVDGVLLDNSIHTNDAEYDVNPNDYGNELKNLNPDDFETVSVLKGAAATALYGSRGLNGAVVITTKGGGKQKGFGVSVTQTLGFDKVIKTGDLQTKYGPGRYSGGVNYGEQYVDANGKNQYYRWDNANQFKLNTNGDRTLITDGGTNSANWGPAYDSDIILEGYDKELMPYSPFKNNLKDAYKTAFNTNTNIAVRGGNDKTSFYGSASYKYSNGTLGNTSFNRFALLTKVSHKISNRVTIGTNISFADSRPRNTPEAIGAIFATDGIGRLYDTQYYQKNYKGDLHNGQANSNYGDKLASVPRLGLWWGIYENSHRRVETSIRPSVEIDVKIFDWVSFKGESHMNYYFTKTEDKNLGAGYQNDGGSYGLGEDEKRQETFAGTLTFNKNVNDFNLGGFMRGEYFNTYQYSTRVETKDGLIVPGEFFIGNSKGQAIARGGRSGEKRMLSAIFAANVGYKNQYYLDITGRNDWSSALVYLDKTGNYSYFYPSVSGSWLVSETFKEQLPEWISFAKLRASWAQVGNDTSPYYINQGYKIGQHLQNDGSMIYVNRLTNLIMPKDLKPERKNAYEFGIDWRFFDSRFGIDATYYKENTKDQIMEISIPKETGMTHQVVNAGNIQNEGIEIAINTIPFRNNDWEWSMDFTYTKNKNKIVSLHPNVQNFIVLEGDPNRAGSIPMGAVAMIGGEYGVLMSIQKPLQNEKGQTVLDWRENYRVAFPKASGKVEAVGKVTPDFMGSMNTSLKYKAFTLSASFDMRFGGHIASFSNKTGATNGTTQSSLQYRDKESGGISWVSKFHETYGQEFHDGYIPNGVFPDKLEIDRLDGKGKVMVGGLTYQEAYDQGLVEPVHASTYYAYANGWGAVGTVSDTWLHEVKYISLRELSLGYKVPTSLAKTLGARSMYLNATARNLGYLYNSLPNNLNPEAIRGNSSAAFRERSFAPYTASFTFTVGVEF